MSNPIRFILSLLHSVFCHKGGAGAIDAPYVPITDELKAPRATRAYWHRRKSKYKSRTVGAFGRIKDCRI